MPVQSAIWGSVCARTRLRGGSRGMHSVVMNTTTFQMENVMTATQNGTLRSRRPQLNDSISKLDEMVDGLATAIPGAVADSIREALGPVFANAVKQAVKEAVAEALKEQTREIVPPAPLPPVTPPTPRPRPDHWAKVKRALTELKAWAAQRVAPVVARATLGWAIVRLIGVSAIHSRTAIITSTLTGTAAGVAGFVLGPVGAAVLLGLSVSTMAATAVWAAPAMSLLVAIQDD